MKKSLENRLVEVKTLYKNIADLGLSEEVCPAIRTFKEICNDFVKNGRGASGTINLRETNRDLIYVLSMQSHVTSHVILKKI